MKNFLLPAFIVSFIGLFAQNKRPEDYGFRHLQTIYKGDTVDILIKSKKGEEQKKKPLFLFCQGSLPIPLIIKYDDKGKQGIYSVFTFTPDSLANYFHLAIIGKPYVPLIADKKSLSDDFTYMDGTGKFPEKYIARNLLSYYVDRNIAVIKFLQKQSWVSDNQLVVAGHSEGSTVAAKLASVFPGVTQLIYSGGNPLGRILSVIERQRAVETDSARYAEDEISNWEKIIADPQSMDASMGDTHMATVEFSIPPIQYLQRLKIPVLVCYGTKDYSAPFNDYLRVEMLRQRKKNFSFRAYIGTEHNYFPLKPNGEVNYDVFNWDRVADDWKMWLIGKPK
ncbi:MAG: hypothetical protein JO301_07615 [Chitinophagaceae bacterium]|nr:hypothetical protein [Chitinophagaceae bacterium]